MNGSIVLESLDTVQLTIPCLAIYLSSFTVFIIYKNRLCYASLIYTEIYPSLLHYTFFILNYRISLCIIMMSFIYSMNNHIVGGRMTISVLVSYLLYLVHLDDMKGLYLLRQTPVFLQTHIPTLDR